MYPVSDIGLLFWPESRAAVARAFKARSSSPNCSKSSRIAGSSCIPPNGGIAGIAGIAPSGPPGNGMTCIIASGIAIALP